MTNYDTLLENIQKQIRLNNQLLANFNELVQDNRTISRREHVQLAKKITVLEDQQKRILGLLEEMRPQQGPQSL